MFYCLNLTKIFLGIISLTVTLFAFYDHYLMFQNNSFMTVMFDDVLLISKIVWRQNNQDCTDGKKYSLDTLKIKIAATWWCYKH